MTPSIGRRALAEFIGTAFLVMAVIGSGIAAAKLSPGDVGLELFENAVVTGAALIAIILALGSVSGAHLNPVITGLDLVFGGIGSGDALVYVVAQITGGIFGAIVANLMFGLRAVRALDPGAERQRSVARRGGGDLRARARRVRHGALAADSCSCRSPSVATSPRRTSSRRRRASRTPP